MRRFESARIVVEVVVDPTDIGLHEDYGIDDAVESVAWFLGDEFSHITLPLEFLNADESNVTARLVVVDDIGEHEVPIP